LSWAAVWRTHSKTTDIICEKCFAINFQLSNASTLEELTVSRTIFANFMLEDGEWFTSRLMKRNFWRRKQRTKNLDYEALSRRRRASRI
jgi:hypothetical protein